MSLFNLRGRTSHEVRGLKYLTWIIRIHLIMSHLTRGAWIEIVIGLRCLSRPHVAPHTRCVDWNVRKRWINAEKHSRTSHEVRGLKLFWKCRNCFKIKSHLTRGAWIEITNFYNFNSLHSRTSHEVRGLKFYSYGHRLRNNGSHLTRGAWIEISAYDVLKAWNTGVAPHTRCVDWNYKYISRVRSNRPSHLTRGAWIEIHNSNYNIFCYCVAPHTRCVDWNITWFTIKSTYPGRTSHEVRGLKFFKGLIIG